MKSLTHEFDAFTGRESRYEFITRVFSRELQEADSILDVGCDQNYLKQRLGGKVYGVDISGTPDRIVNLEEEALSFVADKEYEMVVCMEVLEHLDNLHFMMDELLRVSSRYVLISLPNATSTSRVLGILRTGKNGKFYGLPYRKPVDRHKWFFSYTEILNFANHLSVHSEYHAVKTVLHYQVIFGNNRSSFRRMYQIVKSYVIRLLGWNNQAQDVFVLFERKNTHEV